MTIRGSCNHLKLQACDVLSSEPVDIPDRYDDLYWFSGHNEVDDIPSRNGKANMGKYQSS